MGATTEISWTDSTFNPWWGCQRVSPGCERCYAEAFAKRTGKAEWGPTAARRFFGDKYWAKPLKWNAEASSAGARHRVFCASMADVFEDRRDLDAQRDRLWTLIEATPWLDWQLLTKRPENMVRLAPARWATAWPSNVWAGTTVEDQKRAESRVLWLIEVPAAVRFISYEPALGPVDLRRIQLVGPAGPGTWGGAYLDALTGHVADPDDVLPGRISWVIVGGESGHGARPFEIQWARSVVDQCKASGTPAFVKQMGAVPVISDPVRIGLPKEKWPEMEWPDGTFFGNRTGIQSLNGRQAILKSAKGSDLAEWPDDLRVRDFPVSEEIARAGA